MPNTLTRSPVPAILERLFDAAARDPDLWPADRPFGAASPQDRADTLDQVFMPISARGGDLLYTLVRAIRPATVVEFGTSFGVSTIYLAAGVTDNGGGHVFSTELSAAKVAAARANLAEAGLYPAVTILPGDARETLTAVPGPIDFLLLDGWKDLCLPLLRLLEPRLSPGALVVADDTGLASMASYLDHVRDPAHGYTTVDFPVADGMELSCRT